MNTHRTTIAFRSAEPIAEIDRDFGDYELIDRLAEGGMGVVFRALDRKLQRIVALKMIKGERVADSVAIERFYIEARSAASLRHPHIVAIHNVGEHAGRHFFTMDLIDGRSLADVVDEGLLAPKRAARYVRIAADAIEFAHHNGVLHRDLKPANILIDSNDQPMVTDFGLARPIDPNPGVTATGAILGTPSYMSPEQASPGRIPLTAASDVYSLGATLYELVTGRPPFRGESLLDTLMQVVSMEPVSPRLLNPQVSRDLETIILKCLAKEPSRRYSDARSLSDDLGHFERGEPIVARPPSAIERASRWLRHQQPRVLLGLGAVLFTVLLLVGGTLGWSAYQESRLGNLRLLSEQFGLEAEIFDDAGNLVVPARSLPTRENIVLPTGFYHIRLSGLHQLSDTYHLQLEAGARLDTQLTLTDRHLWEPLTGHTSSNLFTTSDRTDIIIHSSGQMREVNNRNGLDAWAITLTAETAPAGWDLDLWRNAFLVGAPEGRPSLVQPAPDLNGDGRPDLVWGLRQLPSLIAMNGHSGQILWSFIPKEEDGIAKKFSGWGHIVGSPAMHEIDGDGVVDFIGVFSTRHESKNQLIAISGKTGKQLWSRWLPGPWKSQLQPDFYEKLLGPEGSRSPELITLGDQRIASLVAGDHLVSVDVKTGELVADHDLGFLPYRPGQFADLDGDGRPEVLVMRREKISIRLTAYRVPDGTVLWDRLLDRDRDGFDWGERSSLNWPLITDLDGDHRPEIVCPIRGEGGWFGLMAMNGADGETQWWRCLVTGQEKHVESFIDGPDVDGDGVRDVFASFVWDDRGRRQQELRIEAVSGRDGRSRWCHRELLSSGEYNFNQGRRMAQMAWWQSDNDGWPLLIIPFWHERPQLFIVSSHDGTVRHVVPGAQFPVIRDFDGNGILDLGFIDFNPRNGRESFHVLRGMQPNMWRWVSGWARWRMTDDCDGDGRRDLTRERDSKRWTISSRTGRVIGDPVGIPEKERDSKEDDFTVSNGEREGRDPATGRLLWRCELPETIDENGAVNLWTFTGKDGLPWQLFRSYWNDQGSVIARPAWPMESEKRYATPARTAPITEFPSSKDDPRNHVRLTFDVPYGERFKLGVPWLPIGFVVLSLINFMMRRQWKSVRWIGVAILVLAGLIAWEGWIGRPMLAPEQFYVSDGWWWVVLRSMYWIGWLMLAWWIMRGMGRLRRGVGSLWR